MGQKLGQHFLKSQKALNTIVRAGNVSKSDTVLEIGPGKGVLTEKLLEHAGKVIAVEKDLELIAYLQKKFAEEIERKQLVLIPEDIRDFDVSKFEIRNSKFKLIANIPYYITGEILRRFLTAKHKPADMVLLVQKEIAERIVARDGKNSLLSISVNVFGTPHYIEKVPARYFSPPPDVDSAILSITDISSPFQTPEEEVRFFETVRSGFAHKRKLLKSNLGCSTETLGQCNIDVSARAENLTLDQWICLAKQLNT